MKKKNKLILFGLLLLVAATFGGWYAYKEYNRKNKDLADEKADFDLSSSALIAAFEKNEKAANTTYLQKVIHITDMVKAVDKDDKGFYTVVLGDTAAMSSVRCSMDSVHNNEAATLKKGDKISVKGICTGFNADELGLGSDVILYRSVISKN